MRIDRDRVRAGIRGCACLRRRSLHRRREGDAQGLQGRLPRWAACRQPVEDQLDSDIAACDATRDTAVQNCKDLYPDGDPNQAIRITNAQVAAFECRDQARENAKPGFDACAASFKSCATSCPPAQ